MGALQSRNASSLQARAATLQIAAAKPAQCRSYTRAPVDWAVPRCLRPASRVLHRPRYGFEPAEKPTPQLATQLATGMARSHWPELRTTMCGMIWGSESGELGPRVARGARRRGLLLGKRRQGRRTTTCGPPCRVVVACFFLRLLLYCEHHPRVEPYINSRIPAERRNSPWPEQPGTSSPLLLPNYCPSRLLTPSNPNGRHEEHQGR